MKTHIRSFVAVFAAVLLVSPLAVADDDQNAPDGPDTLEVLEVETAPEVDDRDPVDATDTFQIGDDVNAWLAVAVPETTTLEFVWKIGGEEIHTFDIEVGASPRWRTWAQMTVDQAGDWDVEIRDDNGDSLQTASFSVED